MEELNILDSQPSESFKTYESRNSLEKYRKKILSFNIASKVLQNIQSIPTELSQNLKSVELKQPKKVKFTLPIERFQHNARVESNQYRFQETQLSSRAGQREGQECKQVQTQRNQNQINSSSHLRSIRTRTKKSFSANQRDQNRMKYIPFGQIKEFQQFREQRKTLKLSSAKLTSRVVIASKNGKLPQAFEMHIQKLIHKQVKQSIPKIRAIYQKQCPSKENLISLKQQVKSFKQRLINQSKVKRKLNLLF